MSLIDRLRNAASETERPIVSLEFLAANEIESLRQQLAECQATNLQMRGLVDQFLVENDTTEFGCACHPGEGYTCGTCRTFDRQLPLRQAIALPNDATALNELIAVVENRVAEACAKLIEDAYKSDVGKRICGELSKELRSGEWRKYK